MAKKCGAQYITEGELIPWKSFWWRVVHFNPAGGTVEVRDSIYEVTQFKAMTEHPILLLECVKPIKALKDKKHVR